MKALADAEAELKKCRPHLAPWGRKQNDEWDQLTRFIYQADNFDALQDKIAQSKGLWPEGVAHYARNRWYNYWSPGPSNRFLPNHRRCSQPQAFMTSRWILVCKASILTIKTTVFPKNYGQSLVEAQLRPSELMHWLYMHQSNQGRQHFANRLFVVLYHPEGFHYFLKAELAWLQTKVEAYLANFDPQQLTILYFSGQHMLTYCDLIWAVWEGNTD
ncbi:MAG: hypothetical protein HC913_20955 [Microscillaceae bacterium]|nr:hypothetical protein [Microscillaceae bacterium]